MTTFSPFQMKILLHCYACCDEPKETNAPIFNDTVLDLMRTGLLYRTADGQLKTTVFGGHYVNRVLSTPIFETEDEQ